MQPHWSTLVRGAAAGMIASTAQAAIGKTEEKLLLPSREDADIAPRMVEALGRRVGLDPSPAAKWVLGTLFHYAYGAGWGALYAVARERAPVPPAVLGGALGGVIYGITFPRWGVAVKTGTERPPRRRSARMEVVAVSVAVGFGLATAWSYERLRARRLPGGEERA